MNNHQNLKDRFKLLALNVIRFVDTIPDRTVYRNIKDQLLRSATSAAANYRAACRRKSGKDFIAKLGIVEEELDETMFWFELLVGISEEWRPGISPLWKEANELVSITVSSIKTIRANQKT
jgi:four helix bundle protein